METTRNRSAILAQFLRNAVATINNPRSEFAEVVEAVAAVEAVAEELDLAAYAAFSARPIEDSSNAVTGALGNALSRSGEREPSTQDGR